MNNRFLVLLSLIAVIAMALAACCLPEDNAETPASESLETFKKLITKDNYRELGFDSPDEISLATLGKPIRDFMVRLDYLQEYQPGNDIDNMLSATDLLVYPVLIDGETKSSIQGIEKEGKWTAVSFGSASYIKMVMSQLEKQSKEQDLSSSSFDIVRIPAFNLVFLGYDTADGLMLIPLTDASEFAFKEGVPISADDVFSRLSPAAKAHSGLPG
jgi:hypothetical protein